MTQERREHTVGIYPQLRNYGFSAGGNEEQNVDEHEVKSLMELYILELCAVLHSGMRIARCQYCWRYFIPKTNKKTDYCDRKWSGGSTCKMHGPNLKRKDGPAEDKYLLAFKRLRARFYEREYRCYATAPGKTVPGGYKDWIEEACEARDEYVEGRITGEETPQWRTITAKERELDAKQGKVSLREKYKKS